MTNSIKENCKQYISSRITTDKYIFIYISKEKSILVAKILNMVDFTMALFSRFHVNLSWNI